MVCTNHWKTFLLEGSSYSVFDSVERLLCNCHSIWNIVKLFHLNYNKWLLKALLNFTKSLQGSCVYILYEHEIVMAYSPWTKSCTVIGAPRSKVALSGLLETTCCVVQENFPRKPYNKFVIDQSCSVKMAGYWLHFRDFNSITVHKYT